MTKKNSQLNAIQAARNYLLRILTEVNGVKSLILGKETQHMLSLVFSQSELLQHDVLFVEALKKQKRKTEDVLEEEEKQKLPMNAIVLMRGTSENVSLLSKELSEPRFKDYHIYFTSMINENDDLERLAQHDKQERVKALKEYYMDFYALDNYLVSFNIPSYIPLKIKNDNFQHFAFKRTLDGILSLLLAFQKYPEIRYQKTSGLAREVASKLSERIESKDIEKMLKSPIGGSLRSGSGAQSNACTLMILDRSEDPITPLLSQWTYQAMLHELLPHGIHHNRVGTKGLRGDNQKDVALSAQHDSFYKDHMYSGWGELCLKIRDLIEEYKAQTKNKQGVHSIEDLRSFIDKFPQIKSFMNQVDKHVSLVHELKEYLTERNLIVLSPFEQQLVCSNHPNNHLDTLKNHIYSLSMAEDEMLRLAILYCIRYEGHPNVQKLLNWLVDHTELSEDKVRSIQSALKIFGNKRRSNQPQLFGATESKLKNIFNRIANAGFEVENVFTQHKPLLVHIVEQIFSGSLSSSQYGVLRSTSRQSSSVPNTLILFVVGGVTYEESAHIHRLNNEFPNRHIILAGSNMLNSKRMLKEIKTYHKEKTLYDVYDDDELI